ncbi:hypothetical protein FPV67DRAFT_1544318, partial [Lyophyllum atratum]
MRLSIAAVLAALAAAMAVSAVPAHVAHVDSQSICLKVCFPKKPTCPVGLIAREVGEQCWSCCADGGL